MLALQKPPSSTLKGLGVYRNAPHNSSVYCGTKVCLGQEYRKKSHDIAQSQK